ncbi:imidazolonepropionase-like amidohydrolase [Actinoplanes lutulentus]|uniref:Imidazolonepropionase-like amidohydrolase n=1 Tax=Actinoplanes lutulentus TaxID=1287878 RepID=A0A327ZLR9_9ACTN|nr:amidohydrolase family protein [Actinoplanes lutulentus]MBB2941151.1 imidazolonepropionase-like amidohydrolase [Actinoplanes lutulentus]RAK43460.1 imidazolonepropionase-like amidohydrolase [Actinoplanes lutulentus]
MGVVRVRGWGLPSGEPLDLYADGGRWTTDPVRNAELVGEGWLLPGLVDAHTHPGAVKAGDPLDHEVLREDLRAHVAAGVTLVRAPGLAGEPPEWFGRDDDLPRAVHAGPWIAQHGQFFDGWGRRAELVDLPGTAAAQAESSGWAKIVIDWWPGDPIVPVDVLREAVAQVHAAGGRLAVHSTHTAGCLVAVEAGVDSLEHGMGLDPELLHRMAAQGTALTPTLSLINAGVARLKDGPPDEKRQWYLTSGEVHGALTAAAVEAGVTVLAGTDSRPHGRISDEVRAMVAAGVSPHEALGAASWTARDYLGLGGLVDGAPADAVVFKDDPRKHLGKPEAVIMRGKLIGGPA